MAMKNLSGENLAQAYSAGDWEYTSYDAVYAGAAGGSLFASVLRFDVPAFVGVSAALDVALVCNLGQEADVTLRWALCTSDANKALYAGTADEVTDVHQIASGTAVFQNMSSDVVTRSFRVPTIKIKSGGTYYLFLWAYNDTGISIRAVSSDWGKHSVSVGYNIGVVRVQTADGVKMFGIVAKQGGEVKRKIPCIKTPSGVKPGS